MKQKKGVIVDYTQGNIVKQLIAFAIPFMLSQLLQVMYSLVDSIVVGQYVGSVGLSGVNIATQITNLVAWVVMGFASAGQVIVSQRIGAKDVDGVSKTIGTLFTVTCIMAVFCTVICLAFTSPILTLLNAPEGAFEQAQGYLRICAVGFIFICGYNAACAILRGSGDSKRPFIIIATCAVTNLILDLIFVVGLKMEASGAALATVISQCVSMILCCGIFYRNREDYHFEFCLKSFKPDSEELKLLMKLGIPLAIKSGAINASTIFIMTFINAYGVAASAAYAVGSKLQQIPSIITMGLFNAASAMIGQNLGAEQYDRIKKIVRSVFLIVLITFSAFGVIFALFPTAFFRVFTSDTEVLSYAWSFILCLCCGFVANIFMTPFYSVIVGIGHSSLNLAVSLLDSVVLRIGLGFLFGKVMNMGVVGFYLGNCLAAFGTSIPSMIYYFTGRWKNRSLVKK